MYFAISLTSRYLGRKGIWCLEAFYAPNAFLQAKQVKPNIGGNILGTKYGHIPSIGNGDTARAVILYFKGERATLAEEQHVTSLVTRS